MFSTDDHFAAALKRLKRYTAAPPKGARKSLTTPSTSERAQVPVPALGARGLLDGKQQSLRQHRITKQVEKIIEKQLAQSPVGSLVEITEVSLSADIRNVTIWWQYNPPQPPATSTDLRPGPHSTAPPTELSQPGLRSAWLQPPPLSREEKSISSWLETNSGQLRHGLTMEIQLKYSPKLTFRCDKATAHSKVMEDLLGRLADRQ